jgi:probable addiction module antidote protein
MDDSTEMFRKALKDVAQAHQMSRVAKESGVKREHLYRAFSSVGNPTLETLHAVLKVLDIKHHFLANAVDAPVVPTPTAPRANITGKNKKRSEHETPSDFSGLGVELGQIGVNSYRLDSDLGELLTFNQAAVAPSAGQREAQIGGH